MMSAVDEDDSFDTAEEEEMNSHLAAKELKSFARGDIELVEENHSHGEWEQKPLLNTVSDTANLLFNSEGESEDGELEFYQDEKFTVEDAVENMGFGWFQMKLIFICGLFTMTDALEMLLLSVLSPVLRCEWMLSDNKVAFITTVVFIGMFSGSAMWGKWADQYGRKPIMMIAAVWICYMGILTAFSPNYYWILILRGLVGCGFGGAVQSFTLMSEYMGSLFRAKVLIIYNITWALGSCFEVWLAYAVIPTLGWRWLVGFSALPSIISIFCIKTLPESARFLVAAGRKDEALKVLRDASSMNKKKLPRGSLVESLKVPRGRVRDLLSSTYLRTTLLLWLMWFATAFTYYGVVLLNSEPKLLHYPDTCGNSVEFDKIPAHETCHCHLPERKDYVTMIIATFGEFCAIPFNLLTIDTLGRKWTLAINFCAAAIFFMLIQICTKTIGLTIFVFGVRAFASGTFNAIYIYTSEVYPTTLRSLGLGSSSSMARVGAMITPFVAQVILNKFGVAASTYVYGAVTMVGAIASLLLPIETKGREMPQTQR